MKMASTSNFWLTVTAVTCIKFLFMNCYRSTDFEVHRNWLAITHSLPVSKWYYESTSQWTLDYPPLFAWFEFLLSHLAKFFDPAMLNVMKLNYATMPTVFFQRLSVIISDFVYIYAVKQFSHIVMERNRFNQNDPWIERGMIITMLLLWNPGLLMVDHIHFQYNGMLSGILLLSMARMIQEKYLEATFWFSVLLNMKHIYFYIAPAYFVYLLRHYCFIQSKKGSILEWKNFCIYNFLKLSFVVLSVFSISFGPFILMGQMSQVLSRLFPFKRGLTHAYWAPNIWAVYNTLDKGLALVASYFHLKEKTVSVQGSMTGGLIQEYKHEILPSISPLVTLILTLISILPVLWVLWKSPKDPWIFMRGSILCAFGAFLFGWHVHEKAILMVILPLTPLALFQRFEAEVFLFLATIGHYSIFPLLFKAAETPIKIFLLLLHSVYAFTALSRIHRPRKTDGFLPLLNTQESLFLLGLIPLQMYYSFGNKLLGLDQRLPFLPLLLISTYCAFGIFQMWIKMYKDYTQYKTPVLFTMDGKELKKS
ncbi:dolichyl pyrophosphate Glc1Man9GlcNAc2 alpha-1,3-glucosyltransferase [Centruroides vittatus]|uniref:dolichyl pyrophosphate Glc1Man9GlcNAc2 alpha-1,3-glucosyltransferase n=1 Tax=Centruroides vittatus TaxID=120091 RepID=UPI00350FA8C7